MGESNWTEQQAAEFLGTKIRTLQEWRRRGFGPTFRKIGRLVRYSPTTVQTWAADQERRSTSDQGKAV